MFGQLADRIATVKQDAFFAVDIGQRAFAAGGRGEAGIIGEHPGLAIKLADVDHIGADRSLQHRKIVILAARAELRLHVRQFQSPI